MFISISSRGRALPPSVEAPDLSTSAALFLFLNLSIASAALPEGSLMAGFAPCAAAALRSLYLFKASASNLSRRACSAGSTSLAKVSGSSNLFLKPL